MKNCRDIRWDLSAYLDDELTAPQRTEVEAHLASCARCQHELSEMKRLVTGVVTLPKLQPPPRFLTEVRRKIARPDKPEALTWADHVFRPFWLKVPLEVAALIVIIGLVMRDEHSLQSQKIAPLKLAQAEGGGSAVLSETSAKTATANEPRSTIANLAPATGTPVLAFDADKKQSLDGSAAGPRRIPVLRSENALSTTPLSAPSSVIDLVRSVEFPQSKPGEVVTVHARVFDEVRKQAQQLAMRCGGKVVVVPEPKDATERTFFVQLPQEYVAAFKVELLRTSGPSAAPAKVGSNVESATTSGTPGSAGVLTGNAPTNNSADSLATFGLRDDAAASSATLLEIRVVAPAN